MNPEQYETAVSRHADLKRKLEARKRVGEGYTSNAKEIEAEITRLAEEIAAYDAETEEG